MILHGVRVVEAGQVLAGPFAGAILADLGAQVIKIEKPEGGDDARQMGMPFLNGDALLFHEFNRGKHSVVLDLKSSAGSATLDRLVSNADIFIHNLRPGVPRELGFSGEELCKRHPRLIYCEISGFGHKGPMALEPAFEPLIQAFSGLVSINGDPAAPPSRLPISAVDLGTAMWTVIGALAALRRRDTGGRGCIIRTSLLETGISWAGQRVNAFVNEGREFPREPLSAYAAMAPYQAFEASDGQIFICAGNHRLFVKACGALGHPEWVEDPRFGDNRKRITNRAALVELIQATLSQQTREHWLRRLKAAGVPCAPVNSIPEALATEQVASLDLFASLPNVQLVRTPIWFDEKRLEPQGPAPKLGEHNDIYGAQIATPSATS